MPHRRLIRAALRAAAALALLAGGAGVLAGPALAATGTEPGGGSGTTAVAKPDAVPWATVNVCDTPDQPGAVGIRGSMPGTGDRDDELFMRLQLQFFRRSDGAWRNVGGTGDSGLIDLGSGAARVRQAGRTFTVTPPAGGGPGFLLRGLVTFEWRHDGVTIRRTRRTTTAGHPGTPGADPEDFSAAACAVR